MPRRRIEKTGADELLDELLEDYQGPEAILGKEGLLKQLSKRLVERALQAELSYHLQPQELEPDTEPAEGEVLRNSRNGYSAKTVQGDLGQIPLQVPRDRQSTFEPVLVPTGSSHQRSSGLVIQPRISGKGDCFLLHCGVHIDPLYFPRFEGLLPGCGA